jgi:MFS family permease
MRVSLDGLWPRGGLWRHPDFLKLWGAQTISQFGTQVSALALPLAAILVLGASAFQVALLGTVEFLPFLLFTLPAGVWIDRIRRRSAITPDRMLGRVNSVSRFVMWGTLPLGSLLGGALGSTIGLRETMWIGAVGAAFCVVPVLLSPVRTLERLPEAPEAEAAELEPTFAFKPLGVDESGA